MHTTLPCVGRGLILKLAETGCLPVGGRCYISVVGSSHEIEIPHLISGRLFTALGPDCIGTWDPYFGGRIAPVEACGRVLCVRRDYDGSF